MGKQADTNADDDVEAQLIAVGPGGETDSEAGDTDRPEIKKPAAKIDDDEDGDGDARAAVAPDDGDARVGHGEGADDDEQRDARRKERSERKRRQKEARARDDVEMNFLRQRNEVLERRQSELETRVSATENVTIESRIQQINDEIRQADDVISRAVTAGKGEDVVAAQNIRDELLTARTKLNSVKQQRANAAPADDGGQARAPAAPRITPRQIALANAWRDKNSWFTGDMDDPDNAATMAIDKKVKADGFDPATPEYWTELSKRVSKHMPKRSSGSSAETDDDDEDEDESTSTRAKNDAPSFSSRGKERPLKKGEVYISAERKQAMQDANVWEDPKLRQKYLKSYARYDAQAKSGGRA